MRSSLICLILSSLLLATPVKAEGLKLCGVLRQGEILRADAGAEAQAVTLNGRQIPLAENGGFLLVLGRDEAEKIKITVTDKNNGVANYILPVAKNKWDIQSIKGVEQRKVTPAKEDNAEILREQTDVRRALTTLNMQNQSWKNGFDIPLKGTISGNFGNQRIFNGIPKNPHSGTDIAAPEGTPVKAAGDGYVVLNGSNYFYGGNMVIIDHGEGLQTIYMHLKKSAVKEGEYIKKGQVVGYVGKTGRATGPHLHWGASLNNVRFRPHSLMDLMSAQCAVYYQNKD